MCSTATRICIADKCGDVRGLLALRVARQRSNCERKAGQVMWQGRVKAGRRAKVLAQLHSPCELALGWRARPVPASREKQGALALVVRLEPGGVGCRLVREGMAEGYARMAGHVSVT